MESVLQLVERQRERKANRSTVIVHNSSGSDVHYGGATFTLSSLNATHDVDGTRRPLNTEPQQPTRGAAAAHSGSVGRRQPCADGVYDTSVLNHVRHGVDEPVLLRSESSSLWKKNDPPKVIPRKVASVPVSSHQSRCRSICVKCYLCIMLLSLLLSVVLHYYFFFISHCL